MLQYKNEMDPNHLHFHNGKLRGYILPFQVVEAEGKQYDEKLEIFNTYNNISKKIQRVYPKGINQVWQVPGNEWAMLLLESSLFSNAI